MIARVKYQNKIYYSYVFAHFEVFYRNHYVVFDSIESKFDIVSLFSENGHGPRQIGLIDERESGFIPQCDLTFKMGIGEYLVGYPWLVRDPELLRNIEEGKDLPEELVLKAKEMNASIDPDKWNEVINEEDVKNMINHTGLFHDQYLVEIKGNADYIDPSIPSKVQLRFTSQGPFDVLVEFEGAPFINLGIFSCNRIYSSAVVIGEKAIYWVNDVEDGILESEVKDYSYIASEKLRWKFILKEEDW